MFCNLCKKEIPSDNFSLHEAICQKNNVKCTKCEEILCKSSIEDHMKQHELKTCENCEIDFESAIIGSHLCTNPTKSCKYCEVILKSSLLTDHISQCESRTQECPKCLKYIMNKDWDSHQVLDDCSALIEVKDDSSSDSSNSQNSEISETVRNNDSKLISYKCKVSVFRGPLYSVMTGVRIVPKHMNRYFNANDYEEWISQNYQ